MSLVSKLITTCENEDLSCVLPDVSESQDLWGKTTEATPRGSLRQSSFLQLGPSSSSRMVTASAPKRDPGRPQGSWRLCGEPRETGMSQQGKEPPHDDGAPATPAIQYYAIYKGNNLEKIKN